MLCFTMLWLNYAICLLCWFLFGGWIKVFSSVNIFL
uniref:Uncharacterized protein n=1 Tax=Rhizophora mucronata TaxID=61149 RepID=A0A2P2P0K2_RHIMU